MVAHLADEAEKALLAVAGNVGSRARQQVACCSLAVDVVRELRPEPDELRPEPLCVVVHSRAPDVAGHCEQIEVAGPVGSRPLGEAEKLEGDRGEGSPASTAGPTRR